MANEIQTSAPTGSSLYFIVRNSATHVWNTGTPAFETFLDAHWSSYKVSMAEQGTSGYFIGNFPTGITTPGVYTITIYSGSGTESDSLVASGDFAWTGTGASTPAVGLQWISVGDFKQLTNNSLGASDDQLAQAITIASDMGNQYLGKTVTQTDYVEVYAIDSAQNFLKLNNWPVQSITSIVFGYLGLNPVTITGDNFYANTVGTVTASPTSTKVSGFGGMLQVTYTAGYAAGQVPPRLQQACALIARGVIQTADAEAIVTGKKAKDVQYNYANIWDDDDPYFRQARRILDGEKSFICI